MRLRRYLLGGVASFLLFGCGNSSPSQSADAHRALDAALAPDANSAEAKTQHKDAAHPEHHGLNERPPTDQRHEKGSGEHANDASRLDGGHPVDGSKHDHSQAVDGQTVTDGQTSINSQWAMMSTVGAPSPRYNASAVWTGSNMLVWGGQDDNGALGDGASYDPVKDSWATL